MADPTPVSFREAVRVWARVGLHSFGGPAGQIAFMHRELVETRAWISEKRFFHALNYCMVLPGPEAMQLATYVGWLMHGLRGGLVAGGLFVLPGFLAILALSVAYALYQDATWLDAVFFGVKAAVLAVVVEAVVRIGRRAVTNAFLVGVAALAFVSIFFLGVPFPFIILGAAVLGWAVGRKRPDLVAARPAHRVDGAAPPRPPLITDEALPHERPSRRRTLRTATAWLAIWWLPVLLVVVLFGASSVFTHLALFFSAAAVVTFGGAYAVLAYVAQQAVEHYAWLMPGEMLDGLGLAETTPGPLIMVVQFVGFLGAFRHAAPFDPVVAGVLASVIVTWVTFAPSFLWIFVGGPYIEHLRGRAGLDHALGAITAAVVGVILNLAVWFALHVLFPGVQERSWGPVSVLLPDLATLDVAALVIALGAFVALLRLHWGMIVTLGIAAAAGFVYRMAVA